METSDFRLPGSNSVLAAPQSYITGVLRNFGEASVALGRAVDTLVVRLGSSKSGAPDYQIQTLDGEDIAAFSGKSHKLLHSDITIAIPDDRLQSQMFNMERVKDWLNTVNGEGLGGGSINPLLSDQWKEADVSDPRD